MKVFLLVGASILISLGVATLIKSRRGNPVWHELETG
ncbi:hypothetical protein ABH922_004742 [Rhodococcus sp. 27YEA15]